MVDHGRSQGYVHISLVLYCFFDDGFDVSDVSFNKSITPKFHSCTVVHCLPFHLVGQIETCSTATAWLLVGMGISSTNGCLEYLSTVSRYWCPWISNRLCGCFVRNEWFFCLCVFMFCTGAAKLAHFFNACVYLCPTHTCVWVHTPAHFLVASMKFLCSLLFSGFGMCLRESFGFRGYTRCCSCIPVVVSLSTFVADWEEQYVETRRSLWSITTMNDLPYKYVWYRCIPYTMASISL